MVYAHSLAHVPSLTSASKYVYFHLCQISGHRFDIDSLGLKIRATAVPEEYKFSVQNEHSNIFVATIPGARTSRSSYLALNITL